MMKKGLYTFFAALSLFLLPHLSTAQSGKYLNFDGINDVITATQQSTVANNFTIEFWANPTNTTTLPTPANPSGEGYGGGLAGQRYVIHPVYGGPFGGGATLVNGYVGAGVSVGTNGICVSEHGAGYINALLTWSGTISGWTHIAIVYTNKTPSLYINGVLTATGLTSQKTVYVSTTDYGGGQYGYFKGDLDELRIWDYALSAGDIFLRKDYELSGTETGLVDYYPFNQGTAAGSNTGVTTLTDATTITNTGTLTNFTLTGSISNWLANAPAIVLPNSLYSTTSGAYLNFDGVNDNITATQQSTVANNFTMEFWAKPTGTITLHAQSTSGALGTTGQRFAIFPTVGVDITGSADDAGAGVSVGTNGVCVTEHGAGYLPSVLTWTGTITEWTHIAVVYTNKQPALYINGFLVATGLISPKINVFAPTTAYGGGVYGHFQGDLDEVRIWNNALSGATILANKNLELTGTETGLIDYYPFNQGIAAGNNTGVTSLTDITATANNGTLNGFALTGATSNWRAYSATPPGNKYIHFDGIDDNITATQQTTIANNFTMEFWVNPTGTISLPAAATSGAGALSGQRFAIFPTVGVDITGSANDAGAGVSVGTNGICVTEHGAGYLPSLLTWAGTISGWTHVAVVYTNKQPSLYINGFLVATGLTSSKTNVFATTTGYGGGAYGYFQGSLDELRIWNTALNQTDLSNNKDNELIGTETGLINYYRFNQGLPSGINTNITTLADATATGNAGVLNNFTLTGSTSNWINNSTISLTSSDADNVICADDNVTFTATGGTTYEFFVATVSQGAASATNTFSTTTLTNNQTVSAKIIDANGDYEIIDIGTTVNVGPTVSLDNSTMTSCTDASDGSLTISSPGSLYISEINLGQNAVLEVTATGTINITGYKIVVSDSYTNINIANLTALNLSNAAYANPILYENEVVTIEEYFLPMSINWASGSNSWVIIVDSSNNIVDAVFWGWSSTDIDNFSLNYTNLVVTNNGAWTGNGITPTCGTGGTMYDYHTSSLTRSGPNDTNTAADWTCAPETIELDNLHPNLYPVSGYLWGSGQTTRSISGLTAGSHSITVTGAVCATTTTFIVGTVVDITAPTALTKDVIVQLDASGNASITVSDINNGSTDNCAIGGMTLDITTFTTANLGPNVVNLTVTDASGNSSTKSAIVIVTATSNVSGEYLNFDGLDDKITATQQTTVKNNFTIEFWAKPTTAITTLPTQAQSGSSATTSGQRFAIFPTSGTNITGNSTDAGAGVSVGTNGICVFEHGASYFVSLLTWSGTITEWTHIAVVYTNKQPSLYINGVLTTTGLQSLKTNVYASTESYGGGQYGYFKGNMDELRIWDNALCPADILANKDIELTGNEPGLIDYYQFNQGIANSENSGITTLTDAATPTNNGTLNNFAAIGWASNWLAFSTVTLSPPNNKYLNFDGVDDKIVATQQTVVKDDFTIEFWANPTGTITLPAQATSGTSATNQRYVVFPTSGVDISGSNTDAGAGISVGTNGVCVGEHGTNYIAPLLVWSGDISGWTHIAVVYTNKRPSLYINGVLTYIGLQSIKDNVYASNAYYGGNSYGNYKGDLDELRIWDNALSATTILANKDTELTGNEAGLMDYYKFNEGLASGLNTSVTTLTDATNTPNNGTLTNFALTGTSSNWTPFSVPVIIAPPSDKYINFDGTNDKITATQATVKDNFTIEFWAKPTSTTVLPAPSNPAGSGYGAISAGQRFAIHPISGGPFPAATLADSKVGAGVSVGTNGIAVVEHGNSYINSLLTWTGTISEWTHIAVVYTNKQPSLYINGVLTATGLQSQKNEVYVTTTDYGGGTFGYFKGDLDELRIWDNPLSVGNILARKDIELTGSESGLIDYYQFNEGTASGNNTGITALPDLTTGNNGTLVNFALTGNSSNWIAPITSTVVTATVSILSNDADNIITPGTSVTFTATTANGGTTPFYQWKKNGANIGTNSNTYTDSTFVDGDVITLEMSSSISCVDDVTSNSIIIEVTGVLPVELLSFTATAQDNRTNLLAWQTASEENNEGFDIERSKDGIYFEKIGYVKGNGTTVEVSNYNFIDENPINGINYYRLKQMDFDGQFEYSKIVSVNLFSNNNTITIYPNPVRDELTVTNTENIENVIIYNALGQVIKQFAVNAEQLQINVADLQEGIYTLRLQTKNGTMVTKQFVK